MKNKHRTLRVSALGLTFALLATAPLSAKPPKDPTPVAKDEVPVQLALLLDTSNSMDGLIDQAKSQLWKIVNEFNDAKREGKTAVVQVALYEYGNSSLSIAGNYIRQILPFTRDLDKVSEELFKLTTNGGDEYCGAVIQHALDSLSWSDDPAVYKSIFIAGNEPFTQGSIEPNAVCRAALTKSIVVNTIHCGPEDVGQNSGWHTGAALAGGRFLTINQDQAIVHIDAPQDKKITELSIQLNQTYITYGKEGKLGADNQMAQDNNAQKLEKAGAAVQRAVTKSSANYCNTAWDLVDACKAGTVDLSTIPIDELPAELRDLTPNQRTAFIKAKEAERVQIQQQIQTLNTEREAFVTEKKKATFKDAALTLDEAIVSAVRDQASAKAGIAFGK